LLGVSIVTGLAYYFTARLFSYTAKYVADLPSLVIRLALGLAAFAALGVATLAHVFMPASIEHP
jgi:hypothetical protein